MGNCGPLISLHQRTYAVVPLNPGLTPYYVQSVTSSPMRCRLDRERLIELRSATSTAHHPHSSLPMHEANAFCLGARLKRISAHAKHGKIDSCMGRGYGRSLPMP